MMKKDNLLSALLGRAALLLMAATALMVISCTQDEDKAGSMLSEGKITLSPTVAPVMAWNAGDNAAGTRADATIAASLTGGELAIEIYALGENGNSAGPKIGGNHYSVSADGKLTRLPYAGNPDETDAPLAVDAPGEYWILAGGTVTLATEGIGYNSCLRLSGGAKVSIAADGTFSLPFSIVASGLRLNVKNTDGTDYTGADITATPKTVEKYEYGVPFAVKTLTSATPAAIWGDIYPSSSVNVGDPVLELSTDGKTYRVNAPRQISFPAARLYTFNVRVGATGITVSSDELGIADFEAQPMTDAEARPVSVWNGALPMPEAGYTFSGGDGTTEVTAYVIGKAADLAQLAANVNAGTSYENKYFRLNTDISLNGSSGAGNNWVPIGTEAQQFKGKFDGDMHRIIDMKITSAEKHVGLFGYAGLNSSISNLHVTGDVSSTYAIADYKGGAGGICGENRVRIANCSFGGKIVAARAYAGGIAGRNWGEIYCSKNSGTIYSDLTSGGIAGYAEWDFTACYNEGSITGKGSVGGIVGGTGNLAMTISGCYNTGTVQAAPGVSSISVGGISDNVSSGADNCFVREILTSNYGNAEKAFSVTDWPVSAAGSVWYADAGNDGSENKYWKSVGSWNGGTPVYPKLWWE